MKTNEQGFHVLSVGLILVVIAAIVFIGWKVIAQQKQNSATTSSVTTVKPVAVNSISNKSDLAKASNALHAVSQEANQISSDISKLKQAAQ